MKKLCSLLSLMTLVAFVAFGASGLFAATANPSPASPGYTPMVIPIMGTYSSNQSVVKWKAPAGYRVVHASATARAVTGTSPTLTVDLKSGATSMFSSPISVTAGTITDAVLGTAPNIADESTVSVDFAKGGSYSSGQGWKDITLFLFLKRR
ncbi:hypothetical protein [Geobacter sp.]|uniref:hypothetical protein n=1 Tax=Geobacter sp. TaxID=46610 RepID=UPI00260A8F37|nr:hypothetical protein [Geobacter sp.]